MTGKSLMTTPLLGTQVKGTSILDLGMSYWDAVHTVRPLCPRVNITTAVDQLQPVGLRAGGVASQPSPARER
jgi:hypothetical protein